MITFKQINRLDDETLSLFKTVRDKFPNKLQKTAKKQLSFFIKSSHFFKVYSNHEFIGCVFFDTWEDGKVNFGGFSQRKRHKENIKATKQICEWYQNKTSFKVFAQSNYKEVKIFLLKAGFKKIAEGKYEYV